MKKDDTWPFQTPYKEAPLITCLKRLKKSRPKKEHKIIDRFISEVEFYTTGSSDLSDVISLK